MNQIKYIDSLVGVILLLVSNINSMSAAFKYIPLAMATITMVTFLFFLKSDIPSTPRYKHSHLKKGQHIRGNMETTSKHYTLRRSQSPGVWWPTTLDIIPQYQAKYSISYPSKLEALNATTYPQYVPLLHIIESWNPDNPDPPGTFIETLQHFNYSNITERNLAARYRDAEVPFKIYDIPELDRVVERWSDEYLTDSLSRSNTMVEVSTDNHFMFWKKKNMKRYPDWQEPTSTIQMTFPQWLKIAMDADTTKLTNDTTHYYFHVNAVAGDRKTFVAKDLSFFATDTNNFFITNVDANKGIQCRFGMRGIIAETHYDGGKNMVAMLKGQKRYILTPPDTCKNLGIITDIKHASFRHSVIDWSDIDECKAANFDKVPAIDTIVKEGEVLYIPSYWFHYPISLQYSIQCNSRSGSPAKRQGQKEIESCTGVDMTEKLKRYNRDSSKKKIHI